MGGLSKVVDSSLSGNLPPRQPVKTISGQLYLRKCWRPLQTPRRGHALAVSHTCLARAALESFIGSGSDVCARLARWRRVPGAERRPLFALGAGSLSSATAPRLPAPATRSRAGARPSTPPLSRTTPTASRSPWPARLVRAHPIPPNPSQIQAGWLEFRVGGCAMRLDTQGPRRCTEAVVGILCRWGASRKEQ